MNRRVVRVIGVAVTLSALLLGAASVPSAAAQSGPRPGASDPIGTPSRYYVLHDDEVFNPGILPTSGQATYNHLTHSTTTNLQFDQLIPNDPNHDALVGYAEAPQLWTAVGRFTDASYDQVATLSRTDAGNQFGISFVDQTTQTQAVNYAFSGLADRVGPNTTDQMALSAGDLDGVADESGRSHDEVVVAYASQTSGNPRLVLAVLNYTSTCQGPVSPLQPCGVVSLDTGAEIYPDVFPYSGINRDRLLATAVGDFDGNGRDEIAVAYLTIRNGTTPRLNVTTYRYTSDGTGSGTLASAGTLDVQAASTDFYGSITLAAGDFDGSAANDDELLFGVVRTSRFTFRSVGMVHTISFDTQSNPALRSSTVIFDQRANDDGIIARLELEPGLFKFDQVTGFSLTRRQVAVAYSSPDSTIPFSVRTYIVGADMQLAPLWGPVAPPADQSADVDNRFSIAAGGFRGVTDPSNPVWGLAYMANASTQDANGVNEHLGMLDGSTGARIQEIAVAGHAFFQDLRMELAAYDYAGDAIYLGAPVHFTIHDNIDTDFVLQEPPKHSYYDNNPQSATYGQVITISRRDEFNVSLQDSTSTAFESTSTDTTATTIGEALEASAGLTVKKGFDIGIAKLEGSLSGDFKYTSKWSEEETTKNINSQFGSRTVSFAGATNRDDYLSGRAQIIDIWRYRVYGFAVPSDGVQRYGFYDIMVPGPAEKFAGGGQSFDWYQPLHENGNILSYPVRLGENNRPVDLGAYTDAAGKVVREPMVPSSQQAFDGTSGSVALQYESTSGQGFISGYEKTETTTHDVKASAKVTAKTPSFEGELRAEVKNQWSAEDSYSEETSAKQTTGSSTGITLSKPAGSPNQSYAFAPMFYITQDGTVKAAHSVSVLGSPSGRSFWSSIYGSRADPALNLPGRFDPLIRRGVLVGWQPNTGTTASRNSSRKLLRGFALRDAMPNPVSNTYDYLAYAPATGEPVRVTTNVYNYSTGVAVSNLLVQFEAVGYNATTDAETPFTTCPRALQRTAKGRCIIGQTTIGSLGTAGTGNVTEAAITWDTSGFGPSADSAASEYRIYAVLDPTNTIDELYETEDPNTVYPWVDTDGNTQQLPTGVDPGQNNEGYGYATVVASTQDLEQTAAADVYLTNDSLGAVDARSGQLRSDAAQVTVDNLVRIRLTLHSDLAQREFNDVLIYDGDPNTGGVLLAYKRVFAGNPESTNVWVDWLPERVGPHTLYAKVIQDRDDPRPGNYADIIEVTVVTPTYRTFTPLLVNQARID